MLADNSHHLIEAGKRRHDDARRRAQDAIRAAATRGEALPVSALAVRAGVSRAFLYSNPDLIDAIRQVPGTGDHQGVLPTRQRATEASLLSRLEALTQRNKALRTENHDLRQRLEIVHGELHTMAR